MTHVSISKLRDVAPAFSWSAERTGFGGYQYRGTASDGSKVLVYARSTICGPGDDDFATLWFADDGTGPQSYSSWSFKFEAQS